MHYASNWKNAHSTWFHSGSVEGDTNDKISFTSSKRTTKILPVMNNAIKWSKGENSTDSNQEKCLPLLLNSNRRIYASTKTKNSIPPPQPIEVTTLFFIWKIINNQKPITQTNSSKSAITVFSFCFIVMLLHCALCINLKEHTFSI